MFGIRRRVIWSWVAGALTVAVICRGVADRAWDRSARAELNQARAELDTGLVATATARPALGRWPSPARRSPRTSGPLRADARPQRRRTCRVGPHRRFLTALSPRRRRSRSLAVEHRPLSRGRGISPAAALPTARRLPTATTCCANSPASIASRDESTTSAGCCGQHGTSPPTAPRSCGNCGCSTCCRSPWTPGEWRS